MDKQEMIIFRKVDEIFDEILSAEDIRTATLLTGFQYVISKEILNLNESEQKEKYNFVFDKVELERKVLSTQEGLEQTLDFHLMEFDEEVTLDEVYDIEKLRYDLVLKLFEENSEELMKLYPKKRTRVLLDKLEKELQILDETENNSIIHKLRCDVEKGNEFFTERKDFSLSKNDPGILFDIFKKIALKYLGTELTHKKYKSKIDSEFEKMYHQTPQDFLNEYSDEELEEIDEVANSYFSWANSKNFQEGDKVYDSFYTFLNKYSNGLSLNITDNHMSFGKKILIDGKNIQIRKDWIGAINKTDNELKYRNMPYDDIFFNTVIDFNEDFQILGIIINNLDKDSRSHESLDIDEDIYEEFEPDENFFKKNIKISYLIRDKIKVNDEFKVVYLNDIIGITEPIVDDEDLNQSYSKNQKTFYNTINKKVLNFCFNVFDMLNHRQINTITNVYSAKRNKKRIERGEIPKPLTTIELDPNPELKKYFYQYNTNRSKIGHMYEVRGFYRKLDKERNKELYEKLENDNLEGNYIISNGTLKTWVKPHFRGEGILVKKGVELK